MGADLSFRFPVSGRCAGLILALAAISGCKTEADPDQPTLLGAPPAVAYLGVEYYYNWGAYGGESILDYSLTNEPAWLALEDTSNKARQGIIMRGVPGLTGGSRGESDLGQRENIELVTTDGRAAGFEPFSIDVKHNLVALEETTLTEGETQEPDEARETRCAIPELDTGSYSFNLPRYSAADGAPDGFIPVVYETRRAFARVTLDQPSVTRVALAFEFRSDFDPGRCDNNQVDPNHQDCRQSSANRNYAVIGEDIVALGDPARFPVDQNGEPLTYIRYATDDNPVYRGVITFEPGVTECYIPFEVVDDRIPEEPETVELVLTEVREGIASLGSSGRGLKSSIVINDNEPELRIETLGGGNRDTINAGETRLYRAILQEDRTAEFRARLARVGELTGVSAETFEIVQESAANPGSYRVDNTLVFPVGQNEVEFGVRARNYSTLSTARDDNRVPLGTDRRFQAGRDGYVRPAQEVLLELNLNRLTSPLSWADGFVPTDVAVNHNGRLFVAGYDPSANNQVQVRVHAQDGVPLETVEVTPVGMALPPTAVYIDAKSRVVSQNNNRIDRHELAVAFSIAQSIAGEPVLGGTDALVALYHYESDAYQPTWPGTVYRAGTSGDDTVRWVGINRASGALSIGGETRGAWPGQSYAGGIDSFIAQVHSQQNAGILEPVPGPVKQVGSSGDETVAGGDARSSLALNFGNASTTLDGLGKIGPYFFNGNSSGQPTVYQVGVSADESLGAGVYDGAGVVLLGSALQSYGISKPGEDNPGQSDNLLVREAINSRAGFALGFSLSGQPTSAFTLNDIDDSADEWLTAGVLFDRDLVVAGSTTGRFTGNSQGPVANSTNGIFARLNREDSEQPYRNWRSQLASDNLEILDLENYRDHELVALVSQEGERKLILLGPEGDLLTPLVP
ncbi:hypothetical protein C7H09_13220 [Marinobacter fuscus]|uniref:Uncharacterized protein n=1 Tax=Marinobacter fuscus TaxID=2109942 RepID=A0A2T1K640_9GAMM|nr:hypothetical protein [Marinobacter fuscus]PSF05621.1 hypothetical protein C7H09_13220 [Marinobacter fuscus]